MLGCCARAANGHTTAAPLRSLMNARRLMRLPKSEDDSLPHQATGLRATGEEWVISFTVSFNDINDLARPKSENAILGPMSYNFGLGDEGSICSATAAPPANRRPDHARGGCATGGSIHAPRVVITRAAAPHSSEERDC
jgi:hypothetical protein